jgi:phospholipid/cholesterol/gamma-HCH transport system substrate-binding protein
LSRTFYRDFLTGLTALAGLVGTIFMLVMFGEVTPSLIERTYDFRMRVANAGGLDDTSPVMLNGVKVGQVVSAEAMGAQNGGEAQAGAVLSLRVRRGIAIPKSARISVDRGFVGGSSLEFQTTDLTDVQLADIIKAGETFDGGAPETLMGAIKQVVDGPLRKLGNTAEKIDALAQEYTVLGKRLNDMVEPRTLDDVRAGKEPNLRSTLARADVALASADSWLSDPSMRQQVRDLLDKGARVMDDAQRLAGEWSATAEKVQGLAGDVRERFNTLATDARQAMGQVEKAGTELAKAMEAVNSGQGTLGQLVNNPDLYRSLNDAAMRLDKALNEAQQAIEKFKAEGIKIKL